MKRNSVLKKALIVLLLCLVPQIFSAQGTEKEKHGGTKNNITANLWLQNMWYWRGAPLSVFSTSTNQPTPLAIGEVDFHHNNFSAGFWTGQSFTSDGYKNFSYYVGYKLHNFTFQLWDIYTFSGVSPTRSKNFFNFNNTETQHFLDLSVGYQFKKIPLSLFAATIVYGRDGALQNGDYKNRYSSYVKANYKVNAGHNVMLDLFISGSAALNNLDNTNFYGTSESEKSYGVTELGIIATKNIHIADYTLPVSIGGILSPLNKRADGLLVLKLM